MNGKPGKRYLRNISLSGLILVRFQDTLKGSYYANPIVDRPRVSPLERDAYPEYYGDNICETDCNSDLSYPDVPFFRAER